jgi:predicted RNA binding protein YcfA (HicA-like mRNA interferase family)
VRFDEFVKLLGVFEFRHVRTTGSHQIFAREGIAKQINLQKVDGKVKPYQVRQFLRLVEQLHLQLPL